jgi:hypothetical protein
MKIFLLGLLLLSGCGTVQYHTTMILDDGIKKETIILNSNIPSSAEIRGNKIDQRGISITERLMNAIPKKVEINQ